MCVLLQTDFLDTFAGCLTGVCFCYTFILKSFINCRRNSTFSLSIMVRVVLSKLDTCIYLFSPLFSSTWLCHCQNLLFMFSLCPVFYEIPFRFGLSSIWIELIQTAWFTCHGGWVGDLLYLYIYILFFYRRHLLQVSSISLLFFFFHQTMPGHCVCHLSIGQSNFPSSFPVMCYVGFFR